MCPHCGQNAPIVYRGVAAYCSACQRQRPALIAPSVSYAGKPSTVGGTVAGVIGWLVLFFGLSTAAIVGVLLGLASTALGLVVGIPIAVFTLAISLSLLLSGRSLRKTGVEKQKQMRKKGILALAMNRGGAVTAYDVGNALDMPTAEADAFLTEMAKADPEEVTVELDDKGGIYYAFPRMAAPGSRNIGGFVPPGGGRARIEDPRIRVSGVPDTFESEGLDYEEPAQKKQQRRGP